MSDKNVSPRRCDIKRMTFAERMIMHAIEAVEEMPPDVRLTTAVIHLQSARECVADFVDGIVRDDPGRPVPPHGSEP